MKYLVLILLVVIATGGAGGYFYYTETQKTIQILTENNAKLEMAIAQSEDAIKSLQSNYAAMAEENNRINQAYADIRRQNNRLASKIADMDLGILAVEKPESMQRAVNRGTVNAGRCFELLSGAELTEEERNATEAEDFNKECPWLWPGPPADGLRSEPAEGDNGQ